MFGPVTFENLIGLLRSRSILEDEHCQVNDGEWGRVGDVSGLRESELAVVRNRDASGGDTHHG